jgi:hypothetical protein
MRKSLLRVKRVPDYVLIDRTMFFLNAGRLFVNRLSNGAGRAGLGTSALDKLANQF